MPESRSPPMVLTFSLTNIMKFLSYMAPFLISFFMIMFSILTGSIIKGLIFISGLLIVTFLNYLLKNSLKSIQNDYASPLCNTLPAPFTLRSNEHIFNSPSTSSTIIAFTLAYLVYPMILKPENMNPVAIMFLFLLLGINGSVEVSDKCTPISGVFLGSLVGILFGIIFFSLIKISGNESLAFFTEQSSNGIQCSKPGKTQFRCFKKYGSSVSDLTTKPKNDGSSSSITSLDVFNDMANERYAYVSGSTYTEGTLLPEAYKIPVGFKCPSSKDDLRGGTICDLGGYCSNNMCVACRNVNDCYKRNYSGGFNSPYNSWNINALKCGVFQKNSKNWQVKIYKCGTGDVSILTKIKRAWRGRNNGRYLEEEGGYGIDYPANHRVKQCVEDSTAVSTYKINRGGSVVEEPSIDGILFVQQNNIANDQNGLRLNNSELTELLHYIVIVHWVGPSTGRRQTWASEAERDIKKLLRGLKNIPFYSNEPLVNYSDEQIGNFRLINSNKKKKDEYITNSNFNKDGIYVLPWDKI